MSEDMSMDSTTAGDTLRQADELGARTRRAGRWYARYMMIFGAGFGAMTLLLGLGPREPERALVWTLVLIAFWAVFVLAMVVWGTRRPVQGELRGRTYVPGWVGTGVLYTAALFGGLNLDLPVWAWVLAAVAVPLPMVLPALRLQRSLA